MPNATRPDRTILNRRPGSGARCGPNSLHGNNFGLTDHPIAADPEACPQQLLVDLADAGHRQLGHELDVLGRVRGALARFHEVDLVARTLSEYRGGNISAS